MPPRSFDANNDFGLEILCVIATDPAFASLAKNLILKGGGALLHGHHSGRATRRDLDFGLWTRIDFGRYEVDQILVRVDDWQPRSEQPRDEHDGSVNIPISFIHPKTKQSGSMEMQISRRTHTIPPRLEKKVQSIPLMTSDGQKFEFAFMPLEEIVAEKAIRCFNPRKGPREEDLYDIGFAEEIGFDYADTDWVFSTLRRTEGQHFPFRSQAEKIDEIVTMIDTPRAEQRILNSQLYESYVVFGDIKKRVSNGAALVKRLGKV